ncbi:MAG: VWA domain-containing protein [Candidatus Eremiobacteraeota bacterium]|nr:VWA domain-containing protein [Candidatus Eremiobacteraeota bacterium]
MFARFFSTPSGPGAADFELLPLRNGVGDQGDSTIDLLVRIHPPKLGQKPERPSLNLCLVLDRSGSMAGAKLHGMLQAAHGVVDNLTSQDYLAVVVFDDQVKTIIPSQLVSNPAALHRILKGVEHGGSTALHAGWLEGATQTAHKLDPGRLNRVLVLTDGEANVGVVEPDVICSDVNGAAQRGVSCTTLGFGDGYNEVLLRSMASSGNGNHYFVETPEQLPGIFNQELGGLVSTIAQQVRLSWESAGSVQVLTSLEKDEKGRLRLNDLMVGNPIVLLLRLTVPAGKVPQATFRLEYQDLATRSRQSQTEQLSLPVLAREEWLKLPLNPEVQEELELWQAAEARAEATMALRQGDNGRARQLIDDALIRIQQLPASGRSLQHRSQLEELQSDISNHRFSVASKKAAMQSHSYSYSSSSSDSDLTPDEILRLLKEQGHFD